MRRSLFANVFAALLLTALAAVVTTIEISARHRLAGALAGLFALAGIAYAILRPVRSSADALERAASRIVADGAGIPATEPGMLVEFDALAQAISGASSRIERTLNELSENHRELEAMLDSMQDAVVAVDSAGRIQWMNQRMRRLVTGPNAGQSARIGHPLVETIRDPDILSCVRTALSERTICEARSTSLLPGQIFGVNAAPMPGGGAVAVLHDITRIEQVERTQRDFVANVSHELRTPLTSISGYVETLLDHEHSLSLQARDFLSTILKNATRMNRLTEDLLLMARVESAEQELHPVPVRADLLVRDAVEALRGMVQDLEASLEVGATTDCPVLADTDAVLQVLSNLIENGLKYGQSRATERGRVVVSAREVGYPVSAVEFSVRDFGQGIASEDLGRIFERFYRVDKARSRESGGTGLGLSIARHIVQTQGGSIWAESELNVGSTFLFTLPKAGADLSAETLSRFL